jgi:tetratricopeptide (TPR) repeat protein
MAVISGDRSHEGRGFAPVRWTVAAVGLAAVLFAAGLLAAPDSAPPPHLAEPSHASSSALLGLAAPGSTLERTISSLQARLKSGSDDWRSYASLGLAYLQRARLTADPSYYTRSEGALRRSLNIEGEDNFEAALGMAILASARHDFGGALKWGKRARLINPYNSDALGVLGDAFIELGRYGRARQVLQHMINLRPDLASYARVSYFREINGDTAGAIDAMTLALGAAGTPEDAAWAGYQLGELYLGTGRLRAARQEYERAAFVAADSVLPKVGLAEVAAARGDLAKAIATLDRVVTFYPSPELVSLLGDMYRAENNFAKATEQYALVRAINNQFLENGVNPDVEMLLFNSDHRIDVAKNLALAARVYRSRRTNVEVADALAWAHYASRNYSQARTYSRESLRLGTRNALFHFHAGMIDLRLGNKSAARDHLSTALKIDPNFSWLHMKSARRSLAALRS